MAFRGPQEQAQQGVQGPNTGNPGGAYNMEQGGVVNNWSQQQANPELGQMGWLMEFFRRQQEAKQKPASSGPPLQQAPINGAKPEDRVAAINIPGFSGGTPQPATGRPNQVNPDGSVAKPGFDPAEAIRRSRGPRPNEVPVGGGDVMKPGQNPGLPMPGQPVRPGPMSTNPLQPQEELYSPQYPGAPRYTPPTVDGSGAVTNSNLLNFNLPRHHNQRFSASMGQQFDPAAYLSGIFGPGGW